MVDLSIALKNAPNGLELYSPWLGDVTFEKVEGDSIMIKREDKSYRIGKHGNLVGVLVHDDECAYVVTLPNNGYCTLYPSQLCKSWYEWESWIIPKCIGSVILDRFGYLYLVGNDFIYPTDPGVYGDKIRIEKFDFIHSRFATPEETNDYFFELESNNFKWKQDTQTMCRIKNKTESKNVHIDQIMTGDAFLFNGKKVEVVVLDSTKDLVGVISDGIVGWKYLKVSDLEAIPITENLVVRNGFVKTQEDGLDQTNIMEYETDDKKIRITDFSDYDGKCLWYLHIEDDDMDTIANMCVDSFHDLQHAYRRYGIKRGLVY